MQILNDEALILATQRYGEHDAIAQLFCARHGLVKGVIKRGFTKKQRADTQPATLVNASWSARLPEHMGTITLEATQHFAARVMHDPLRLCAVGSAMALLSLCLAERDPHPELYTATIRFLQSTAAGVAPLFWMSQYVRLELMLLSEAGYGLDLSCCVATGETENLAYVSPKSGRAVSRDAGAPYKTKLLALPCFLHEEDGSAEDTHAIRTGLALTGYFLESRMLPALHRTTPHLRAHLLGLLAHSPRPKQALTEA